MLKLVPCSSVDIRISDEIKCLQTVPELFVEGKVLFLHMELNNSHIKKLCKMSRSKSSSHYLKYHLSHIVIVLVHLLLHLHSL